MPAPRFRGGRLCAGMTISMWAAAFSCKVNWLVDSEGGRPTRALRSCPEFFGLFLMSLSGWLKFLAFSRRESLSCPPFGEAQDKLQRASSVAVEEHRHKNLDSRPSTALRTCFRGKDGRGSRLPVVVIESPRLLGLLGEICLSLLLLHTTVSAQTQVGPFEITGFYQVLINPATGHANPNNVGLLRREGKPDFLLMRQFLDLNIHGRFGESWSATLQPRFFHDLTKSVDNHFRQYESLPNEFSGNGWMLRDGGKDFKAELSQAYVDYRSGPLWLRLGKQQIAWGETVGVRVLDVVNPLDLSQLFFFDRGFEEFDRIRIPQWFLRGAYTFPSPAVEDLTLELILNPGDVVPTLLAEQGAPYNVVPSAVRVRDNVPRGELIVGGRLTGKSGDAQFSLNYITKPNDDGVGIFRSVSLAPLLVTLEGKHPRVHIVGGSLNYPWDWAGALLRFETTVTPNAPFVRGATATRIIERPVWRSVFAVDRPTYVIPGEDSMSMGFQFFEIFTGGRNLNKARAAGAKIDQAQHIFSIFVQQPLFRKRIFLEFLGAFDTDDAHWLQPGIHWELGNNMRLDLFYNEFGGAEKRAGRFGSFFFILNKTSG